MFGRRKQEPFALVPVPAMSPAPAAGSDDAIVPALRLPSTPEKLVAVPALPGDAQSSVFAWEQCRVLRTRLHLIMRERNLRTLLVTSAVAGEGKTFAAANLAMSFSQLEDKRVLLIDADLRRPGLSAFFGQQIRAGLTDCLSNGHRLTDVIVPLHPRLDYLPTKPAFEHSVELLNRGRMRELIADCAARYDLVVIDSAPLSPIADTQVLIRLVDAAVLVVRAGVSPYPLVRQAAELLQPKLIGTVLNAVDRSDGQDYSPYRYYYSPRPEGVK